MSWFCSKPSYYELRNKVWPYSYQWGDKNREIRNYLKKIWVRDNIEKIEIVDTSLDTVTAEKDQILKWWWQSYRGDSPMQLDQYFGSHLKSKYEEHAKFGIEIKIIPGPRQKSVKYDPTDTRNYI